MHLHYTPTYSSWLNQVELWFSKLQRQVISRGIFSSMPDLKRKIMRLIRNHNKETRSVQVVLPQLKSQNQSYTRFLCYTALDLISPGT